MKNQAGMHNIVAELQRRGFAAADVDKIMSGNWIRIFSESIG
jgi:microsomal dipeptidase-like Zn-dependent dipeptidase